ncbi:MAG TPA: MBL fold metallo-hydrolase [Burkholderiales bacterium]|nr:MBL fold metallo-hydrolase [Burkholderiales bacterium]
MAVYLPPQIRVVVRDWLNSNQVVLLGRDATILVDSGYGRDAGETLRRLQSKTAVGESGVDLLVNTHCHSDHMGGNALLQRKYRCELHIPAGEVPAIESWDETALWLAYADQRCERFAFHGTIVPDADFDWGNLNWRALAAPGHDMHALMFFCDEEGILISGDALWENGFGVLLPDADRAIRLAATRGTLDTIAALGVKIVIPGHGRPFTGVDAALERAYSRLDALAADELRMVRALLKTMFAFSLLDRGKMNLQELPAYLQRTPLYAEYGSRRFGWTGPALARWLVEELVRSRVASSNGEEIVATR